jgi:hypothetical protein
MANRERATSLSEALEHTAQRGPQDGGVLAHQLGIGLPQPTPAAVARSRPSTFPTAVPAPTPIRPRLGTPPAAASQAA